MRKSAPRGIRLRSTIATFVLTLSLAAGLAGISAGTAWAEDFDQKQGHDQGRHEGERKREFREQERRREIREEEIREREWQENRARAYVAPRVIYAPPPVVYAPPPPPPSINLIFPLDIR